MLWESCFYNYYCYLPYLFTPYITFTTITGFIHILIPLLWDSFIYKYLCYLTYHLYILLLSLPLNICIYHSHCWDFCIYINYSNYRRITCIYYFDCHRNFSYSCAPATRFLYRYTFMYLILLPTCMYYFYNWDLIFLYTSTTARVQRPMETPRVQR